MTWNWFAIVLIVLIVAGGVVEWRKAGNVPREKYGRMEAGMHSIDQIANSTRTSLPPEARLEMVGQVTERTLRPPTKKQDSFFEDE